MSGQSHGIEEPPREAAEDRRDRTLRWAQATLDLFMYGLIAFALGMSFYVTR